jgi:hypothetical protein
LKFLFDRPQAPLKNRPLWFSAAEIAARQKAVRSKK